MGTGAAEQLTPRQYCSECGRPQPPEDMARFGNVAVCADCKPVYVQRMREGVLAPVDTAKFVYGGFWQRFAAQFLDGIIIGLMLLPLLLVIAFVAGAFKQSGETTPNGMQIAVVLLVYLLAVLVPLAYQVYFLTKKGATPGKSAMGLKVVTASGGPISVGRAIGRYFAHGLSALIFYIGYIMAAFDDEKRALHDRICDTRVILNR